MVDIGGTKKRIQRLMKVVEESYKKVSELLERMEKLQNDLETTSDQVDHIEYEVAEQRVLLEAIAEAQGLDVNELLTTPAEIESLDLDGDGEGPAADGDGDGTSNGDTDSDSNSDTDSDSNGDTDDDDADD